MDKGAAPAAWAIVLLVPPPPQGLPGQCNRHMCGREGQSLLFDQRPPPTHWSRRAHCQMRLSDFSPVQAAQVWTGRAVSAIRPHGHHPLTGQEYILARCGLRSYHLNLRAFNDSEPISQCLSEDGVSDMSLYSCGQGCCTSCLGHCSWSAITRLEWRHQVAWLSSRRLPLWHKP